MVALSSVITAVTFGVRFDRERSVAAIYSTHHSLDSVGSTLLQDSYERFGTFPVNGVGCLAGEAFAGEAWRACCCCCCW